MTVAYITAKDFLFWFGSRAAKEIKWGVSKDKAFVEVVKGWSFPWEHVEMNAIHSLQFILQESTKDADNSNYKSVVDSQPWHLELKGMDDLIWITKEMVRLTETAIAPVFSVDVDGRISGWNAKVAELTGLSDEEAVGKSLAHDLVHKESEETVDSLISRALRGSHDNI